MQTIIRVVVWWYSKDLNVGDIVVVTTTHTDNAMTNNFINGTFSLSVRYLLRSYMTLYSSIAMAGPIMSSDWFYNPMKHGGKNNKN